MERLDSDYLTPDQAAALLNVKRHTIMRYRHTLDLPYYKYGPRYGGGHVRFLKADIEAFRQRMRIDATTTKG